MQARNRLASREVEDGFANVHRGERALGAGVGDAEDSSEEARRLFLIAHRDDVVIEHDWHVILLATEIELARIVARYSASFACPIRRHSTMCCTGTGPPSRT